MKLPGWHSFREQDVPSWGLELMNYFFLPAGFFAGFFAADFAAGFFLLGTEFTSVPVWGLLSRESLR